MRPQDIKYPDTITGSGAAKLASSAIAPLVAAARGYLTCNADNLTGFPLPTPDRRSGQGRRLTKLLKASGDALFIPTYTPKIPVPTGVQYRPSTPHVGADGRSIKYETLPGPVTIGVHPACLASDISDTEKPILIAEGVLKADSAMSAWLTSVGIDETDLDVEADITRKEALGRLREIIKSIGADKRIVFCSINGVNSWNYEAFKPYRLGSGRQIWVGVDGDVATKPGVHKAAEKIWSLLLDKKCSPRLLSPTLEVENATEKIGIDDYLAQIGDWDQLLEYLDDELPPPPAGDNLERIGDFRIAPDGASLQVCVVTEEDADANPIDANWVPTCPPVSFGGWVTSIVAERQPNREELADGKIYTEEEAAKVDSANLSTTVEIKVSWRDASEALHTATITGPGEILSEPIERWHQLSGVNIPNSLASQPGWPVRNHAREWVDAVKNFHADTRKNEIAWSRLGWVPSSDVDMPTFTLGATVIKPEGQISDPKTTVNESTLSGATKFGLGGQTKPDRARLTEAFKNVLEKYLGAPDYKKFTTDRAWSELATAATIMGTALRPVVWPTCTRNNLVAYFWGPPAQGKSWSAGAAMAFWAQYPGAWSGNNLPGTAMDTYAATSTTLSRTPIWVIDDVAPQASLSKARAQQATIEELIRSTYNGVGKSRMFRDLKPQPIRHPQSTLIITGENLPQTASIKQRLIALGFKKGTLGSQAAIDDLEEFNSSSPDAALVTRGVLEFMAGWDKIKPHPGFGPEKNWKQLQEFLGVKVRKAFREMARKKLSAEGVNFGQSVREVEKATDILQTLLLVGFAAHYLTDLDENYYAQLMLLSGDNPICEAILEQMIEQARDSESSTPGVSLLRALRLGMESGRFHIKDASGPAVVPLEDKAQSLGWDLSDPDRPRPQGNCVGLLCTTEDKDTFILFNRDNAFQEAKRAYPELIGHGQGADASWGSVYDNGLNASFVPRRKNSKGKELNSSQIRINGKREGGIAISISTLEEIGSLS